MLHFLADENFDGRIVRGLCDRMPELDIIRVQDVGLSSEADQAILEWAAAAGRIVLSHDVNTLNGFALERVAAGLRMPGVCHVPRRIPIGRAIEDLRLLAECSVAADWDSQILYLPF
jgi:hypothetical protein